LGSSRRAHAVGDEADESGTDGVDPHREVPQQALALASCGEVWLGEQGMGEQGDAPGFGIDARLAGVAVDGSEKRGWNTTTLVRIDILSLIHPTKWRGFQLDTTPFDYRTLVVFIDSGHEINRLSLQILI
jgi:hypothetical protein